MIYTVAHLTICYAFYQPNGHLLEYEMEAIRFIKYLQ